jgi:hypothetical protein
MHMTMSVIGSPYSKIRRATFGYFFSVIFPEYLSSFCERHALLVFGVGGVLRRQVSQRKFTMYGKEISMIIGSAWPNRHVGSAWPIRHVGSAWPIRHVGSAWPIRHVDPYICPEDAYSHGF